MMSEVVLSFHKMDEGLDNEDIIRKETFKLGKDTYVGEVYEWIYRAIPNGFVESVRLLLGGNTGEKQKGRPLRAFPRKPEDSRINFQNDLDWIYRLIRASSKPF